MSQIILSFFDMDLWSCNLGSRRESRPAAETRRADAMMSEFEERLIESLFGVRVRDGCWVRAIEIGCLARQKFLGFRIFDILVETFELLPSFNHVF